VLERSPGNGHVAVEPFAIIEFDDFFPRDQFTVGVYLFPFSRSRVNGTPKFIALITFFWLVHSNKRKKMARCNVALFPGLNGFFRDLSGRPFFGQRRKKTLSVRGFHVKSRE
jgi:hypothetical protein